MRDLGDLSDLQSVDRLLDVQGLSLIEVGCGSGDTARGLAERGATVLGVEPDAEQSEINRTGPAVRNVRFVEAGGEALPAKDRSVDGVLFFRSLHHVPSNLMAKALCEAARVLKPDGFVYVAEPAMDGGYFAVTHWFNDEAEVRTQAQRTLDQLTPKLFEETLKYTYTVQIRYTDFEAMAMSYMRRTFGRVPRAAIDRPEVRGEFEACRTAEGYVLDQPMLVALCRRPGSA